MITRTTVTVDVYFHGDDFPDKLKLAEAVREEIEMDNYDSSGTSLDSADGLSSEVLDSYPWGDNEENLTVRELLSK